MGPAGAELPRKGDTPEMFSEIAHRYDLLNRVLSLNIDHLWRREMVRTSGVGDGGRVLDACTGTADVAIGFARRVPGVRVIGVDRSPVMLEVGRRKLRKRGLRDRVELLECDVLDLPFLSGSFDAATIAFGFRNLADYERGIGEMTRVVRPGGVVLILEFCPPSGRVLRGYSFYLNSVLPVVGGIVSGSRRAYRYLAESIGEFLPSARVVELMSGAGLGPVTCRKLTGGIASVYRGEKTS